MEVLASPRRGGWLSRWHGRIGALACVGLLLWAITGLLHPVMTRLQPQPANTSPPAQALDVSAVAAPTVALAALDFRESSSLRLLNWEGKTVYQIASASVAEHRYINARNGAVLADGESRYAEWLARYYTAERDAKVLGIERITAFDKEYNSVNRLLPVYRVRFERPDQLRVYVDTATSRLATLVDERKSWLAWGFNTLHKWEFAPQRHPLLFGLMLGLLALVFVSAASGLWLYGRRRKQVALPGNRLRRTHRLLGLGVSLILLLFSASGAYHLIKEFQRQDLLVALPYAPAFSVAALHRSLAELLPPASGPSGAITHASLVKLPAGLYYRLKTEAATADSGPAAHHPEVASSSAKSVPAQTVYIDAQRGRVLKDGEIRHAQQLAEQFSGLAAIKRVSTTLVTQFSGEYGFINKLLPVYRVEYATPGHERYYVDPASDRLAAKVSDDDTLEGWIFANLHKWDFLGKLAGKNFRDLLSMLVALGIVLAASLGLILLLRRNRRATRPG